MKHNTRREFFKRTLKISLGIVAASFIPGILSCENDPGTYSIKSSKCTGCGKCTSYCSRNAISISNNKASIDENKCSGCGKCVNACSENAITQS